MTSSLHHSYLSCLELGVITRHQSDSQYKFLSIVVIEDTVQVVTKVMIDLLCNLLHSELLVCHPLSVQLQPVRQLVKQYLVIRGFVSRF